MQTPVSGNDSVFGPLFVVVGVTHQVCGLKWSFDDKQLASGGNDNKLFIWNAHSTSPVSEPDDCTCITAHEGVTIALMPSGPCDLTDAFVRLLYAPSQALHTVNVIWMIRMLGMTQFFTEDAWEPTTRPREDDYSVVFVESERTPDIHLDSISLTTRPRTNCVFVPGPAIQRTHGRS